MKNNEKSVYISDIKSNFEHLVQSLDRNKIIASIATVALAGGLVLTIESLSKDQKHPQPTEDEKRIEETIIPSDQTNSTTSQPEKSNDHKSEKKHIEYIRVNGYADIAPEIPPENKNGISVNIYNLVSKNYKGELNDYGEGIIRPESFSKSYNDTYKTYSANFIVDLPQVEESYHVATFWAGYGGEHNLGDTVHVTCLPKKDLKYGEFKCWDGHEKLSPSDMDPILKVLPLSTTDYYVTNIYDKDSNLIIDAKIFLYGSDYKDSTEEEAIAFKKAAIIDELKKNGINPDNYNINFHTK